MQTFLPYEDFERCATVLDFRRLNQQINEVNQLLNALHEVKVGWRNHPVTLMWRGHEPALCHFGLTMADEWKRRGYNDNAGRADSLSWHLEMATSGDGYTLEQPEWMGNSTIHRSYQSLLLRKAHTMTDKQVAHMKIGRDYYDQFFPGVPDDLPFVYPEVTV